MSTRCKEVPRLLGFIHFAARARTTKLHYKACFFLTFYFLNHAHRICFKVQADECLTWYRITGGGPSPSLRVAVLCLPWPLIIPVMIISSATAATLLRDGRRGIYPNPGICSDRQRPTALSSSVCACCTHGNPSLASNPFW